MVFLNMQINREEIRQLIAIGKRFDISKGGIFDARMGAINIWASPEDKPEGYDKEIFDGEYNRDYIATLSWNQDSNLVNLTLDIDNKDYLDWAKEKVAFLLRMLMTSPKITGTKCPMCDFVLSSGYLLNDLIHHIQDNHGKVNSLSVGYDTRVTINNNSYKLEDSTI